MTLYTCLACQTGYTVTKGSEPSPREPRCLECGETLPDRAGEDWLRYRRSPVTMFKED
jgi:hypothetical protein